MKTTIIMLTLLLSGCATMTPEERQSWNDVMLRATTVTAVILPVAIAAGAYSDIENAQSIKRISKK